MRTFLQIRSTLARGVAIAAFAFLASAAAHAPARAQAIVLSVNGDPITSVDVEQRMKLLHALRRPAGREAAIESMVEERLKTKEASRFGVNIKDNEIGEPIQSLAKRMKISPTALLQNIKSAGVSDDHTRNFFKGQYGYNILIKALNRGVEASETAVRGELAKEKSEGGIKSYTIRQIVFTFNPDDPPSVVEASVKQAQALRGRFTSCETGLPYAKSLPNVAVRAKLVRSSTQLSDQIKEVLDKTPIGHLTEPTRSPNGIELVAVCGKSATGDDEELRRTISDRILAQHFAEEEAAKYKEMRSHAVISRAK